MNSAVDKRPGRTPLSLIPFVIVSLLLHTIIMRLYVSLPDSSDSDVVQERQQRQVTVETLDPDDIPDFLREDSAVPDTAADTPTQTAQDEGDILPALDIGESIDMLAEDVPDSASPVIVEVPEAMSSLVSRTPPSPPETASSIPPEQSVSSSTPQVEPDTLRYNYTRDAFRDVAAEAPSPANTASDTEAQEQREAEAVLKRFRAAQKQAAIKKAEADIIEKTASPAVDTQTQRVTTLEPSAASTEFPGLTRQYNTSHISQDVSTSAADDNNTIISTAPLFPSDIDIANDSATEDIIVTVSPPERQPIEPKPSSNALSADSGIPETKSVPIRTPTTLNHSSGPVLGYIKQAAKAPIIPAVPPAASVSNERDAQRLPIAPRTYQRPAAERKADISVKTYTQLLSAWVAKFQKRPSSVPAFVRGSGTVLIDITRDGRVVNTKVTRSSGSAALDEAAIAMVRAASPVTPVPEDFRRFEQILSFAIPFTF